MSTSGPHRERTLYPGLLQGLPEVPQPIRRLHGSWRATGSFRIRTGSSPVAAALVRLLRLPSPAGHVASELTVEDVGSSERWVRRFGQDVVVTHQRAASDSLLSERFGCLEVLFELVVEGNELVYRQRQACLCLGRRRVHLPCRIAPFVRAREAPGAAPDTVRVTVEVEVPLVGLLVAYDGQVSCCDEPCA